MKLLSKLIFRARKQSQMVVAIVGAIIGLIMLIATVQYYAVHTEISTSGEDLVKNGFEIQKKVSALNTLNLGSSTFDDDELEQLKDMDFVRDIAPIRSNNFKVYASVGGDPGSSIPEIGLLLFFESIPDKFIKGDNDDFEWSRGDTVVPIIIPADYLNLFNYGFAPSQKGIPQISEEMLSSVHIDLKCEGVDQIKYLKGRIVGFTAKINSIMVPDNYLSWANNELGGPDNKQSTNRAYIVADPAYHHEFVDLIEERGYVVNETKLMASEQSAKLQFTISILIFVGSLIIILSLLNFVQYSQILINEASYEIGVLTNIGYDFKKLSRVYFRYFTRVFILITVVALVIGVVGTYIFSIIMEKRGFEMSGNLTPIAYVISIVFLGVGMLVSRIGIKNAIRKMAEKN